MVGVVAHQALRVGWFIDDAAITFAYARNLAQGHGLVPWPGGERVEAYSNPTWLAVLAVFQALGLTGFTVAKPLAMALGVATVPVVYRLTRLALPDHPPAYALVAPILLAISPQFAIWSASGLENALFAFLLAAGGLALLEDVRRARVAPSALLALGLVWSRPEGFAYACALGVGYGLLTWAQAGGRRRLLQWAGLVAGPSLVLELARLAYFAWPLPSAWYAKVEARGSYPFDWSQRGWSQLRHYGTRLGHVYLLPAYVAALTGVRGRGPARLAVAAVGLVVLLLLPDVPAVERLRVLALYGCALGALALVPGRSGAPARAIVGVGAGLGIAFHIAANGDWMGAFRWMSLIAPLQSVLLAVGLAELAQAIPMPRVRLLVPALGVALLVPFAARQTRDHVRFNRNETPAMIGRRADYLREVVQRTFFEGPVVHLDPDLGGYLWSAPDFRQIDMAKLADVPMGRHWYHQPRFVREYVFEERQPIFAHVHGWWAEQSGLQGYPKWAQFVALPPYRDQGGRPHDGMWVHRRLLMDDAPPPVAPVARLGPFAVDALRVPPEGWASGGVGYVEAPVRVAAGSQRAPSGADTALVLHLTQGGQVRASAPLPLGYGWLAPHDWRPGERFRGQHPVPVAADLALGTYALALTLGDGPLTDTGVTVRIRPPADLRAAAVASLGRAVERATAGQCDLAERTFVASKRLRPAARAWHVEARAQFGPPQAACLARRRQGSVADLVAARWWDPRSAEVQRVAGPLATGWIAEGRRAAAAGDWETAYARFRDAVAIDPTRAWARRWAEQARDHRLGLTHDRRIGMGGARSSEGVRPGDEPFRPRDGRSDMHAQ